MIGYLTAAACILIWGVTFVNTKALLVDFSSFEILVVRFAMAYAALWAIAPRRFRTDGWREELRFVAMGLSGVAVYQYLENCAINYTNASNVSILVSACPMGTAALSSLILKEKAIGRRFLVGFALAMTGVTLVCLSGVREFHFSPFGDFVALGAMMSWSVYSVLVTEVNRKGREPALVIRRTFFWALVAMAPFVPFGCDFGLERNLARFASPTAWLHLGFLGLLASALAFVLWNRACQALGTVRATCGLYLIPAVTAVVAHFALGESLTAMTGVGAAVTILGVMIGG